MKRTIVICLLLSVNASVFTQQLDTVFLQEVEIRKSATEKFLAGNKVEEIDSATISQYQSQDLGALLQDKTPIYLKSYGTGQLSTVSFRGTGASHTAVLWNGVNINSLTMGQTDFSTIPVSAVQELKVQYGSASTLYGSGAVGGSVLLNSNPSKIRGLKISLDNAYNSLQNYSGAIGLGWGNDKVQFNMKYYSNYWKNQFEFVNISKIGHPTENSEHVLVRQKGLIQDVNINMGNNKVYLHIWINDKDRLLQSSYANRQSPDAKQSDRDASLQIGLKHYFKNSTLEFKATYLGDKLSVSDESLISTSDVRSQNENVEYEWRPIKILKLRHGAELSHIKADVNNFDESGVKEKRASVFTFSDWEIHKNIIVTTNLRKQWVSGFNPPVAISTSLKYQNSLGNKIDYSFFPSFSTGYRVPSLNDRFWSSYGGFGNENVLPEKSTNFELGLSLNYSSKKVIAKFSSSLYQIQIKDYILWVPSGGSSVWSPQNIQEVKNKGIEYTTEMKYIGKKVDFEVVFQYSYLIAEVVQSSSSSGFEVGTQLRYVPRNKASSGFSLGYNKFKLNWDTFYTGQRRVTETRFLDAFITHNIGLSRTFNLTKSHQLNITLSGKNIFNKSYELYWTYAAPSRYFECKVNYLLNVKPKSK